MKAQDIRHWIDKDNRFNIDGWREVFHLEEIGNGWWQATAQSGSAGSHRVRSRDVLRPVAYAEAEALAAKEREAKEAAEAEAAEAARQEAVARVTDEQWMMLTIVRDRATDRYKAAVAALQENADSRAVGSYANSVLEAAEVKATLERLIAQVKEHGLEQRKDMALDELLLSETDINRAEGRRKAVRDFLRITN